MKIIINKQLKSISGGNPGAAAAAGAAVAVVAAAGTIIETGNLCVDLGKTIGEAIYKATHKDEDPLGKMEFKKSDYSQAYLDYKYPPYGYGHPNNMNANNFHGSFGNF